MEHQRQTLLVNHGRVIYERTLSFIDIPNVLQMYMCMCTSTYIRTYTVEDKKTFPFGISRTMLLRGVSLTFYVNGRLKTVIERS